LLPSLRNLGLYFAAPVFGPTVTSVVPRINCSNFNLLIRATSSVSQFFAWGGKLPILTDAMGAGAIGKRSNNGLFNGVASEVGIQPVLSVSKGTQLESYLRQVRSSSGIGKKPQISRRLSSGPGNKSFGATNG
jgi:hypothetical protein